MAHQRGHSTSDAKEPHSVSLKVLRLSRPSLSHQHVLPPHSTLQETAPSSASSLAYPRKQNTENSFILAPILTLPQAFGSAYVGETFSCTLCANNELQAPISSQKTISNVRIEAEMKVPSSATPISLSLGPDGHSQAGDVKRDGKEGGVTLKEAESLQRIVQFRLEEEGSHVLSVTVTYSETTPTSGRVRTFRKLYQFVSKNCVTIRTKSGLLPVSGKKSGRTWALEAQLQNDGEDAITLDQVGFEPNESFKALGLNWELEKGQNPVLSPGEVEQVCFLIDSSSEHGKVAGKDEKIALGRLSVGWRGQMGNHGSIETGELSGKVR